MNDDTPARVPAGMNPSEDGIGRLTRILAARLPRRNVERGAVGVALAALGGIVPAPTADARKRKKKKPKKRRAKKGAGPVAWRNQTTFGTYGNRPSQFSSPAGLFISDDGATAFVADSGMDHVSVWTRSSASGTDWANQTTFGARGSGAGELNTPSDVFLSNDGLTAFVADFGFQDDENHRVSVWTRDAIGDTDWANQTTFGSDGSGPSQFNSAVGVAVSRDGKTAFVADINNHRISVWLRSSASSTDWTNQTTFGSVGSGSNQLHAPWSLFVTEDGLTMYIAEVQNSRDSVWTRTSATSSDWANQTTFGTKGSGPGQLEWPTDVFVAEGGLTAFVADHDNHRISVWRRSAADSTDWANQTTFGKKGSDANELYWPTGVFASEDGRTVFVSDTENGRVSVWTLS